MKDPAAIREHVTHGRSFHFESQMRAKVRDRYVNLPKGKRAGAAARAQEQAHEQR